MLIRTLGPLLLRGATGGAGATGGGSSSNSNDDDDDFASEVEKNTGGRKVSVSLPSFEVGADDDDEDEDAPAAPASTSSSSTTTTTTSSTSQSQSSSAAPLTDSFDDSSLTRIDLPTTFDDDKENLQLPLADDEGSSTDKLDTENQIV